MIKRRNVIGAMVASLCGAGVGAQAAMAGAQQLGLQPVLRARSADPSPRPVTRGESPEAQQAVSVDWLNATFPNPGITPEALISHLSHIMRRPVTGLSSGRGMFGFAESVQLEAHVGSRRQAMGCIAYGGDSQNGRWLLQITGGGCALVPSWDSVVEMLDSLGATLTRLDLACDFLDGRYTPDDAQDWYREGGFTSAGRPPSISHAGDWFNDQSRTLYIGKAKNGKLLRVYEKGHQLGDMTSPWTRFEVQFGNRDRVIPIDALVNRESYFAGAYPVLAQLVQQAVPTTIETTRAQGEISLSHLFTHLRRTYGKAIDAMTSIPDFDVSSLVDEVRVSGLPRRVLASSLEAAPLWSRFLDLIRRS